MLVTPDVAQQLEVHVREVENCGVFVKFKSAKSMSMKMPLEDPYFCQLALLPVMYGRGAKK